MKPRKTISRSLALRCNPQRRSAPSLAWITATTVPKLVNPDCQLPIGA
jgi:hypothetical protein